MFDPNSESKPSKEDVIELFKKHCDLHTHQRPQEMIQTFPKVFCATRDGRLIRINKGESESENLIRIFMNWNDVLPDEIFEYSLTNKELNELADYYEKTIT